MLDPCCGSRIDNFDRAHPDVVLATRQRDDHRHRPLPRQCGYQRVLRVEPDVPLDFRALPAVCGWHVQPGGVNDPPHLVRGPKSWLAAKYGKLGEDWRDDRWALRSAFACPPTACCLQVERNAAKVTEVLALTPGRAAVRSPDRP